jgi:hypothetical protein
MWVTGGVPVEPLFARLSDRYHLVAPDYAGFAHSSWPDHLHRAIQSRVFHLAFLGFGSAIEIARCPAGARSDFGACGSNLFQHRFHDIINIK